MKNIKKAIILILCIVLVLILAIIIIKSLDKNNEEETELPEFSENLVIPDDVIQKQTEQAVQEMDNLYDRSNYYNIKTCFKSYLEKMKEQDNEAVLAMLSENYIEENKITTENINNFILTSSDELSFEIVDLYKIQNSDVKSYAVHGVALNSENKSKNVYFVINLDKTKFTFSIEFIDKIDKLSDVKSREITSIEKNSYNTYMVQKITTELVCKDYMEKIRILALANPSALYNVLNKEYREARFGSVDELKTFVSDNKENIASMELYQYQESKEDDTTMYVCKDKKGNFYIINEKGTMDFDIMLDAYTIELEQTKKAYEEAEIDEEIVLDIETAIMAINNDDYSYIYNLLEDNFKKNFTTKDSLKKKIRETFYDTNVIDGDVSITKADLYYTCTFKLVNYDNTQESKDVRFNIYLEEGTKFKMSFKI